MALKSGPELTPGNLTLTPISSAGPERSPKASASRHSVRSWSAGGDGFVVLERLKSNRLLSAMPVIVVTTQGPEVAEQKARECGAVAFLQKPVKADELIATIQGVLGKQE